MDALILLSGGLDSAVVLALALDQGKRCRTLTFDYGQRHKQELRCAAQLATHYGVVHNIVQLDLSPFPRSSSALLTSDTPILKNRTLEEISGGGTPSTYVPGRNTLFLAYAFGLAEAHGCNEIHFGPHAQDRHAYPDCTPAYISAFQQLILNAQNPSDRIISLIAPLLNWTKEEIIQKGRALHVPFEMTWSCYDPTSSGMPCGHCDACIIRSTIS